LFNVDGRHVLTKVVLTVLVQIAVIVGTLQGFHIVLLRTSEQLLDIRQFDLAEIFLVQRLKQLLKVLSVKQLVSVASDEDKLLNG